MPEQDLLEIAKKAAEAKVQQGLPGNERECILEISAAIGEALVDAGFSWDALQADQRRAIAREVISQSDQWLSKK